jgi:hypothetical protein
MIKLVGKEVMIADIVKNNSNDGINHRYNTYSLYKEAILGYIDGWKSEIEKSPDGQIMVGIRHIRDNILGEAFKEKTDMNVYNRIRFVLLEYGIEIKLKHHYGANLIMSLAREEDIISDRERSRIMHAETVKKAGFDKSGDYYKSYPSYSKDTTPCDVDLKCPKYLGSYIEEKLMKIFDDASKNPIATNLFGAGAWDWKCKNGVLIKYVASCLHYRIKIDKLNGKEYEWTGWHWAIARNNVPDFFLLVGYGESRENLDVVNAWFVPSNDIVRTKKFWNRESFSIRTDKKKQLIEMKQYEVGEDKLNKMREIIGQQDKTITIDMTIREEILAWYKTYFR